MGIASNSFAKSVTFNNSNPFTQIQYFVRLMKCSWSQQAAQSIGKTLRSRVQGPPIKQQRTARARFRTFYTMQANVEIYKWSWVYLLLITCDRIRIRAITHRQKKGLDLKAVSLFQGSSAQNASCVQTVLRFWMVTYSWRWPLTLKRLPAQF